MAGEDQERFEDYLELEHYIEELQAGHVAHPPADLTPESARIYHMAALFRSASPEAAEPRPEFAASLHARLLAENNEVSQDTVSELSPAAQSEPPSTVKKEQQAPETNQPRRAPRRARFFSRRSLLGSGAVAAASLVVGVGIGAALEKGENKQPGNGPASSTSVAASRTQVPTYPPSSGTPIVPSAVAVPHFVANLADLGDNAVRFTTDTLVGYVIVSDGDDGEAPKGEVIAMSASCTHMGCIVQWQDGDQRFLCPCHGGIFTEYGKPDKASPIQYLTALPRLETLVKDGKVYVMVPKGTSV
jgi:Rieske Fe-S protein